MAERVFSSLLFGTVWVLALTDLVSTRHPCDRECKEGGERKTCKYQWLVENYLVLSRACYDCPNNATDCWRQDCVSADGVTRSIRTINRQLPGPSIQVCEGDTIEVEVTNQMMMSEGLTIHWHGIKQRQSPHMDGVSMLTQCPIPSFTTFTYRFKADDPGTHFYHSHSGIFRGEGLFGALVIRQSASRDPQHELYDLDLPEHEMVVNDWVHEPIVDLYTKVFHSGHSASQRAANILINGRGIYPFPSKDTKLPVEDPSTPFARFDVKSDVRYRFRIINGGALRCPVQVSVDNHHMLLIASDGHPVKPVPVSSILVYSGERYDFVIHTKRQLAGLHWVRAKGLDLCESEVVQQFAILNYVDRHVTSDAHKYPDGPTAYQAPLTVEGIKFNQWFNDVAKPIHGSEMAQITSMTSLAPDDVSLKKKPDRQIFLEFSSPKRDNVHFYDAQLYPARGDAYRTVASPMISNISNILPPAPILTQPHDVHEALLCNNATMSEEKNCDVEFCECVHRELVEEGEVVELIVYNSNNPDGYTHPVHLHGYGFRILAAQRLEPMTKAYFLELDEAGKIERKLHGAPIKDTMPIPNGGFLVLRILANNPGFWFMHCHVATHAEVGMALTLQVKGPLPAPPPDFPRCGSWPLQSQAADSGLWKEQADTSSPVKDTWLAPAFIALVCVNVLVILLSGLVYIQRKARQQKKVYVQTFKLDDQENENNVSFMDERRQLLKT